MPIRVTESPEPMTFASSGKRPVLAECEAFHALLRDISRYSRREILGRSVLISGHRGSGKTTLVRWAIEEAQQQMRRDGDSARPLLVPLHGPDLLGGTAVLETATEVTSEKKPAAPKPGEQPPAPASTATRPETEQANADTRAALRMLTESLHLAYVRELDRCFQAYVRGRTKPPEVTELAARLSMELCYAPQVDALRFVWDQVGALPNGVLFDYIRRPDQGMRELVAAFSVMESYSRVASTVVKTDGEVHHAEQTLERTRASALAGKEFFNSLTGLLAGGVAGAGLLVGGVAHPAVAALLSVATAVGSTATLNYTSTQKRTNRKDQTRKITWDTSIASLDRILPVVVEHIVDAGLAPIFVVDELDKVDGIEQRMENLIRHLKHLVSEKTFFCFLTSRSYFEYVSENARSQAYGREHTFFSRRLFVHYRPMDLHRFLNGTLDGSAATGDEKIDIQVLPFLLLERAKMHPIDLHRALSDLADQNSVIQMQEGAVRSMPGYILAIFMQVAVELLLDDGDLSSRLSLDPNFARLAYDALYMPARSWEASEPHLVLTGATLKANLGKRMADADSHKRVQLSQSDIDLLLPAVRRLADYLRHPEALCEELQTRISSADPFRARYKDAAWTTVADVVRAVPQPILGEDDGDGASAWLTDPFGAPRTPPAKPPNGPRKIPKVELPVRQSTILQEKGVAPPTPTGVPPVHLETFEVQDGAEEGAQQPATKPATIIDAGRGRDRLGRRCVAIREIDDLLVSASGDRVDLDRLAREIRLLSLSPAWPSVQSAITAFESRADKGLGEAEAIIDSYWRMLESAIPAIRRVFLLASILSAGVADQPRFFCHVLRLLSDDLRFARRTIAEINKSLEQMEWFRSLSIRRRMEEHLRIPDADVSAWVRDLKANPFSVTDLPDFKELLDGYYQRWYRFFIRRLRANRSIFEPTAEDLMARSSGGLQFRTDLEEMTYWDYAQVLTRIVPISQFADPLAQAILMELGFGPHLSKREDDLNEVLLTSDRLKREGKPVLLLLDRSELLKFPPELQDTPGWLPSGVAGTAGGWKPSLRYAVCPLFSDMVAQGVSQLSGDLEIGLVLTLQDTWPPIPYRFAQIRKLIASQDKYDPSTEVPALSNLDDTIAQILSGSGPTPQPR